MKIVVVTVIIISLFIFPLNFAFENPLYYQTFHLVHESMVPSFTQEIDAPYLDNYLKIYNKEVHNSGYSSPLTLKILVDDPDGVDFVILKYKHNNDTEYRTRIMASSESEIGEYETEINFNLTAGISQYRVRYFANDSIGNEVLTDEFTYEIYLTPYVTADGSAYLLDTPDLIYRVGTTGNSLLWVFENTNFGGDSYYTLEKDSYLIELDFLPFSTGKIETNVDGLRIGSYLYELTAEAVFGGDYDNATVSVVEMLNSTTPTSPNNEHPDFSYVLVLGFGIMFVLIICIVIAQKERL